jgi:hypothetical protein
MEVILQQVQTTWTKASRGGPLAAIRNAAPVGFPLPSTAPPLVHEVCMCEDEDFRPLHRSGIPLPDPTGNSRVRLQVDGDGRLRVQLELVPSGIPHRKRRPPAVRLDRGEWLRWQINYRFATSGTRGVQWTYRLDTLNIAFGEVPADRFTGDPARMVDERTHLR